MKQFIDKLIERLEEESRDSQENMAKATSNSVANFCSGACGAYNKTIAIVKRLVEEFGTDINVVINDGWIPCNERLPEEQKCKDGHMDPSKEVLVYIYYGENCANNGCGVSRYWNSSKHHENPWIDLKYGKDNVIAWQPLPASYQPKGE